MALIDCPNCGKRISDKAHACPFCNQKLNSLGYYGANRPATPISKPASEISLTKEPTPIIETPIIEEPAPNTSVSTDLINTPVEPGKKQSSRNWLWIALSATLLILLGGGIGGYFYYEKVYLPAKIDREAPRTYPIVNLQLRTSKMAGGEFNKVTTIPAGAELITYEQDKEWAKVKYISPNPNDKPLEGYVASPFLLSKSDFYLVNSIFGDNDAREVLSTAKVRKALLEFYKSQNITGGLTSELASEAGLPYDPQNQWQVYLHHGQSKPNEVLFKRVWNSSSKYTDMAVLIENTQTGNRQIIYATFDDDETPHIRSHWDAPRHGGILDYSMNPSGIILTYTDGTLVVL